MTTRLPQKCIRCPKCDQCSCLASHEEFPDHCLPVVEPPEPEGTYGPQPRARVGYRGPVPSDRAHPLVARLARERLAFGMTRREVATKARHTITTQNMRYMETTVANPKIGTVEAYARGMGYRLVLEPIDLAEELDV